MNSNHVNEKKIAVFSRVAVYITVFILTLVFPVISKAAEEVVDPVGYDGYLAVVYDNTNGLPTAEANDIVQTPDGFVWIGGYGGLTKYDGNNFERIDSTTGITGVTCLFVDEIGRLWVGTNDNGVVLIDKGTVRLFDESLEFGSASIRGIEGDEDGNIYVATTDGMYMISPEFELSDMWDPRLDHAIHQSIVSGPDDFIYGITSTGDIYVIKDGETTNYIDASKSRFGPINCVYPDPVHHGNIYFQTHDGIVYRGCLSGDDIIPISILDLSPLSQIQSFQYIGGKFWICAVNGIGVLESDEFTLLDNLPLTNAIGCMMSDYEGNLWFASTRQGVMKIVPNTFSDISNIYDLPDMVVNSTCMYNNRLFIGADTGLFVVDEEGLVTDIPITEAHTLSGKVIEETNLIKMLKDCRIRSIIRDSKNRLWICTWRSIGLLRYDNGRVTVYTDEDGLYTNNVRTVYERSDGTFLLANTGGVVIVDDHSVLKKYNEKDGIENTVILNVCEGENGDVICGTDGGGVYIIGDGGIRHITKSDGLKSEAVMRIKKSTSKDLYWVISGSSLGYLTPDYKYVNINNFPYANNFDLYENSRGEVWVLSSSGIYVVSAEELLADREMNCQHYTLSNGLPHISTANSYSELTPDMDLYIAGATGVSKVNIERDELSEVEYKMSVPYLDADGERIYPDKDGKFKITPEVRKLTVYPCVFNFSLTDPIVSYRLEGLDISPATIKRSELAPIDYTNLAGGTYRFIMDLTDPATHVSQQMVVVIVKDKAFYEQIWFYLLVGLLTIALLYCCISSYVDKRLKAQEEKNKEEKEKERIGAELTMASRIQVANLPTEFPAFPGRNEFEIYATMEPAKEVGGDFYDFFLIDEDHLCIVMADVSGKGVPAAMFMMVTKAIIQSCAMLGGSPGVILEKTNEGICSNNKLDMFVTVWLGILEISTGHLTASNAGHEYPAIKGEGGNFELYKDPHSFIIGGMEGMLYEEYGIDLKPGDKIFVYTDGIPEATDAEENLFGTDKMIEALNTDPGQSPEEILRNVREKVGIFVDKAEQFDDMTMLCLEYRGPQTAGVPDSGTLEIDQSVS